MFFNGFNDEIWCRWNCIVIDFDLIEEMKIIIVKKKFVCFVVNYEKRVDNKCVI